MTLRDPGHIYGVYSDPTGVSPTGREGRAKNLTPRQVTTAEYEALEYADPNVLYTIVDPVEA